MRSDPDVTVMRRSEPWKSWPVYWSAIWVGVLAGLAVAVVIGLVGIALGARQTGAPRPITTYGDVTLLGALFAVLGAFCAGVVGGWVAARIGGFRRAEPAMLHGAIVWLVGLPILLVAIALGGAAYLGGWYSGLAAPLGQPVVQDITAEASKNAARFAVAGLLIGLIGSVLGGWMASGEPMTLALYRRREITPPGSGPEVRRLEGRR
jgi:hypothetical protein